MNHTTNYNLNQWEADDRVTREDFNADNAAIDAALKTIADSAGGGAKVAAGSYIGNGGTQSINAGFSPAAVLIVGYNGTSFVSVGCLLVGTQIGSDGVTTVAQTTSTGFTVYHRTGSGGSAITPTLNMSGVVYRYLAVG